jgi:metal-sulfur cluster biosynthetic enzyme
VYSRFGTSPTISLRSMSQELDNPNPVVKAVARNEDTRNNLRRSLHDIVFDVIRDIRDPEHPHSLEELSVVQRSSVVVVDPVDDSPNYGRVTVTFTPTVPHCSLASIIGLSIKAKLADSGVLDGPGEHYYKLTVICEEGSHTTAESISKQLADKERVSAAFENPSIMGLLESCVNNLPG